MMLVSISVLKYCKATKDNYEDCKLCDEAVGFSANIFVVYLCPTIIRAPFLISG